ncbi:MAG: FGGY family carbohydrate kinase [Eubacteriales bacterium]|nr:FGGY family carbohydrate kinase [Eubacteriales bacterium]
MILGIDIGTTTVCAARVSDDGAFLGAQTLPGAPLGQNHTQDPAVLLDRVRTLYEQAGDVRAVAVTGQMHGILCLDAQGNAQSPLYTWQNGFGNLPRGAETYAEYVSRVTGRPAASGYGLVTWLYLAENGLLPENTACVCTIGDYAAMRLAGLARPRMHASNAASLGGFDLPSLDFDREAVRRLSLDPDLLPDVVPSLEPLSARVFCACGDNQASFRGSVTDPARELLINVGTGGQLSCLTPGYRTVPHCETRPYDGGQYLLVCSSLCGGRAWAVLERFFRDTLRAFGTELPDALVYEGMARLLEDAAPSSLTADTRLCGSREEPSRTGSLTGLTPESFTPASLAAAFLEGIASEFLPAYDALRRVRDFSALALSGNAVRKNPALRDIFARLYRLPLAASPPPEEAASGAAKLALDHLFD